MKLALVVWKLFPSFVGGTERHSRHLANNLAALGVSVDVICAEIPKGEDSHHLPFRIVPVGWPRHLPHLLKEFLFSRRAARRLRAGDYDVAYGQNLGLWQYLRRKEVPCVMNPHGLEPMKVRGSWALLRGWVRRRALRDTARLSDVVISLGGKLTEDIPALLRCERRSVIEIPVGVDLEEVDRRTAPPGKITKVPGAFLYVGRLASNKGVDVLMEAFRALDGSCAARLYVIGDGPERRRLVRGAPRGVEFLGTLSDDELAGWYQRAEVLVLPSLFEGMPSVVLEAMAFGLPILATDIGAIATMVDDENGLVIQPGSAKALAKGIRQLASLTSGAKAALGRRSRERVEANFTWPQVARKTRDVLAMLVDRDNSGRPVDGPNPLPHPGNVARQ